MPLPLATSAYKMAPSTKEVYEAGKVIRKVLPGLTLVAWTLAVFA
jgi:hypothetical protein